MPTSAPSTHLKVLSFKFGTASKLLLIQANYINLRMLIADGMVPAVGHVSTRTLHGEHQSTAQRNTRRSNTRENVGGYEDGYFCLATCFATSLVSKARDTVERYPWTPMASR